VLLAIGLSSRKSSKKEVGGSFFLLEKNFLSETSEGFADHIQAALGCIALIKAQCGIKSVGVNLHFRNSRKHLVLRKTTSSALAVNFDIVFSIDIIIEVKRNARIGGCAGS